jgi:uncharacterized protein (TIGR02145 family)
MKKSINITTYLLKRISVVGMIIFLGVTQYASAQVEAYPSTSESLISRVGSLVLAPTVSAITLGSSYVNSFARCEKNDNTVAATRTCLDVQGTGSFSNLIANNLRTFLLEKTFVGPAAGVGPGVQTVPLFIDDTVATNDSLMVSDLGRFNVSGQFAPVDTTTMRGVCADANGIFYACAVPESPVSTCPLTFTDTDTNIIYPIVDVDGACWFGRDLQRNQVNDINAGHIYSFMNDAKFRDVSTMTGPYAIPFAFAPLGNELTADIVFVDHGGTTKVVYSSSNYLPATSALPSPYAGDGTYHSINSVFKSFLLDTCDWSTANMVNHTWGGSENYYIIDLQVAQHNEALGSGSYIKPTYNISCREYIDTDSVDPSFDLIKRENFDTNRAESNEFHVNVYTIAEPQMADVINKNKGVFVHVEDIYDYTCPTGWHVPRTAEWDDLETALTTRATAEGTTLSGSTLAAEMKFNPSGYGVAPSPSSGPSYEYRYHVRELVDVVTNIGGASSYNEVRRDGYHILNAAGNITFEDPWQKRFAAWRYWYITGPYISATTPATLFARVIDLLKINIAYASPSAIQDELAGKVRCVRGTELTTSIGGWGSCINVDGQWTQTYVISSCSIGGHSVPVSNCSATSADGPVPGEKRSCIPAAPGGGGKVEKL